LTTANGVIDDWNVDGDACDSPSTGLRVVVTRTPRGAAVETATHLENRRDEPSPLLIHVVFFRTSWAIDVDDVPVVFHSGGGLTDAVFPGTAWRQHRSELIDWSSLRLEGAKGRSSNKDLPIFIVAKADDTAGTAFVAGYSGHVVNTITREVDYRSVVVESSVHEMQLRLPPRARVRLGSMLTLPYRGDIDAGRNLLRRTLREHICPAAPGGRVRPEVTYVHWFGIEAKFTAESLLREADTVAALGVECFEADAAVFQHGTFTHYGAGNWGVEDRAKFPDGLNVFADAVRARGMRFGLWCEPETVEAGTKIEMEHPEWLIKRPAPNDHRFLVDFGNPEAAAYMTRLIGDMVETYGVQWSRVDSNLNPDEYWATIPDPGGRGFRELKHWEGWYRFLDDLRERHPGLHIEGCSSGGRRIDLEMLKRSHSFWISDNTNYPATIHQHIGGANHWLPSHLLNMEAVKYPLFPRTSAPTTRSATKPSATFG
jgi:alpha-galactosidase